MNKPIRCTTHFHACDCREYETAKKIEKLEQKLEEAKKDITTLLEYIQNITDILDVRETAAEAVEKLISFTKNKWEIEG